MPELAGGAAPTYWYAPASPASWTARAGSFEGSAAPAPAGSDVTDAGTSATTQCQKPLPVGACGSYIETTKLLVSCGNPDQASCGERSWPPGTPNIPESCASGSGWPSRTLELVRVKPGTSGRNAYGS